MDQDLLKITRHFFQAHKPVAMVCHGVEIAAAAGCLEGRTATTVAKCELDITQFGGRYVNLPCVEDDNLVSVRTWHDYASLFKPFLQLLQVSAAVVV